jgi:hypothetical protein
MQPATHKKWGLDISPKKEGSKEGKSTTDQYQQNHFPSRAFLKRCRSWSISSVLRSNTLGSLLCPLPEVVVVVVVVVVVGGGALATVEP